MNEPRWMTSQEAANYIKMSASHLRQNLKKEIGYIKKGKTLVFDRLKLDDWMEKQMR